MAARRERPQRPVGGRRGQRAAAAIARPGSRSHTQRRSAERCPEQEPRDRRTPASTSARVSAIGVIVDNIDRPHGDHVERTAAPTAVIAASVTRSEMFIGERPPRSR